MEKPMTFEGYLKDGVDKGVTAYRLAPIVMGSDGQVTFYVHPLGKDGITHDYLVKGNQLIQIQSALEGTARSIEAPQTITPAEAAAA
jgi:hypothetical protein